MTENERKKKKLQLFSELPPEQQAKALIFRCTKHPENELWLVERSGRLLMYGGTLL